MPRRGVYLETLLQMEGPRDASLNCQSCGHRTGKWRCKNCFGGRLLCGLCCKEVHQNLPFHRVEMWNGRYFAVGALWQAGVKIYLGHQGMPCPGVVESLREAEDLHRKFCAISKTNLNVG